MPRTCPELIRSSHVVVDLYAAGAGRACTVDLVVLVSGKASEVVPSTAVRTKTTCQLCDFSPDENLEHCRKRNKTHPTEEKLGCDWAVDGMFQLKVTPDGKVQLCGPPSQMCHESGVVEVDIRHVSSAGGKYARLLQSASLAQY